MVSTTDNVEEARPNNLSRSLGAGSFDDDEGKMDFASVEVSMSEAERHKLQHAAADDDPPGEKPEDPYPTMSKSKSSSNEESTYEATTITNNERATTTPSSSNGPVVIKSVSWFRQLRFALQKNGLLIWRKPLMTLCMLLSSIVSSLLCMAVVGKQNVDFNSVPVTPCGTFAWEWYHKLDWEEQNKIPFSHNEGFRDGMAITVMALGPLFLAICAFLFLNDEFTSKTLGVLRGLGLRESVYWASWWTAFIPICLVNALLGAITATLIESVYVFQYTYFGGIVAAYLFLNLALVGASMFLAAVCSTARQAAPWIILLMIVALFIPYLVVSSTSQIAYSSNYFGGYNFQTTPISLFWTPATTTSSSYVNSTEVPCQKPIVSPYQGSFWKTEEQRQSVQPDEYFMGCFFAAGYMNQLFSHPGGGFASFAMSLFPYMHFMGMWANFAAYTGAHDRRFGPAQASMSAEQLAIESLPQPPNPANSFGSSLYPQGSTLQLYLPYNQDSWVYDWDVCPAANASGEFCTNLRQCAAAVEPTPTTNTPSVHQYIGYLFLLSLFYTLLAAYWAQVLPAGNGAAQRWYFFLLPSYWCNKTQQQANEEQDGITVSNVAKVYGQFEALKGVSMKMERGEVTALLGHNGAGKTTLSHILCCEHAPTSGDATVFGYSVTHHPNAVRSLVGVCKQDDYLYPNLSAKEHLQLFAGLRGVSDEDMGETIQEWLESVDLAVVQDQFSMTYSGGMKRRLSVALATIGDRPFIVLDEPTTGMDPVSRRYVWRHIEQVKEGRVILLTTHAMEEADLLSDTVAVMRKGERAAFGTPLNLKAEYGSALQFTLLVDKGHVAATEATIRKHFEGHQDHVTIDAGEAGNMSVLIDRIQQQGSEGVDVEVLASFVKLLDNEETVSEYGFSNSSLEEVFLKVTSEGDAPHDEDEDEMDVCCACCGKSCITCCLRGPCRCCCCPKPHQKEVDAAADQEEDANGAPDEAALPVMSPEEVTSYKPDLNILAQTLALFSFSARRGWTGKGSSASWVVYGLFIIAGVLTGFMSANSPDPAIALVAPVFVLSLFLMHFCGPIYVDHVLNLFYLQRTQGLLKWSYICGTSMYVLVIQFAFALLLLSIMYATPSFGEPQLCRPPPDDSNSWSSCYWNMGSPGYRDRSYVWQEPFQGESVELYANSAPGSYARVFGAILYYTLTVPGAVMALTYIPGYKFALVALTFVLLIVSVAPMLLYFSFGNNPDHVQACLAQVCKLDMANLNLDIASQNPKEFINCVAAMSLPTGALCVPPAAAMLPQYGVFQLLVLTLYAEVSFTADWNDRYVSNILMPALIKTGGLSCKGTSCTIPVAHKLYGITMGFMALGAAILFLLGWFSVSYFDFPEGAVLKFKQSIEQCMCNPCASGKKKQTSEDARLDNARANEAPLAEVVAEQELVASLVRPFASEAEEGIVAVEHSKIPRGDLPPVVIHKLRKVYPGVGGLPSKVALHSLDLHVPKGQVLGLLGKNGAGKTTALKILAVAHKATSGLALVSGYDVSKEQIDVVERLGNCPQFDIVWPGMSVQRHLEFFAHLKGLPKNKLQDIAHGFATAVGLGASNVYTRAAGSLSGGMRRRLSIAISLIGAPNVLLLDEPSTGLDPSTRNSIWGLINGFATSDRAIIITTHNMIEADTLSNRIAIVSRGNLKVVATQQSLKDRFGSGFLLQLNLIKSTEESVVRALAFVRARLHRDAVLQTKQAKTLHIALPRDVDLTRVFRALYSQASSLEGGINQFLLSQSSLEDVFLALSDESSSHQLGRRHPVE